MTKPRPWIVTPHGAIEKLEDNLWAVQGDVPGVPFKRRMFIIKRSDGSLMFALASAYLRRDRKRGDVYRSRAGAATGCFDLTHEIRATRRPVR